MITNDIARRYAKSLFLIGQEDQTFDMLKEQLVDLEAIFNDNSVLLKTLDSPIIEKEVKKNIIIDLCDSMKLSDEMKSLLLLLEKNKRISFFSDITRGFCSMIDAKENIERVTILSAKELNQAFKNKITSYLEEKLGKKVVSTFSIDKKLISGLKIQIGTKELDTSTFAQLNLLRKKVIK
ncbi:MAG: ATP synthase F1 subunit delta [Pseudomonadota bacterium]